MNWPMLHTIIGVLLSIGILSALTCCLLFFWSTHSDDDDRYPPDDSDYWGMP